MQTILGDNKCQELWDLLESNRQKEHVSLYDIIRYRREAERHVGADDHLYRVDCVSVRHSHHCAISIDAVCRIGGLGDCVSSFSARTSPVRTRIGPPLDAGGNT